MNYKETMEYLESIQSYGIVPGLDSIRELCRRLGNPQDMLSYVHIAGTNGKGSVLAYLSTILKCAGYRVGRYHSPGIAEYRDEIQVNGSAITKKSLCEGVERMKQACEEMVQEGLPHPTPFEVKTALAFWYFQQKQCDIVVLEIGMGGRFDATNLIKTTLVSVLTSISMDHMSFLGKNLEQIAEQKAGIIKSGCHVVSAEQKPEAMAVIQKEAQQWDCPLQIADKSRLRNIRYGVEKQRFDYKTYKNVEIRLSGNYQIENALTAVEAIEALQERGFPVSEKALRKGLQETVWQGRFTVIGKKPFFIADGAHNEDASKKLAESIEFYFTNKRIIYIMGILKDKEYEKIIRLTHKYAAQIITVTPPENPRAMHAYELAQEIVPFHPQVTAVDSLEEAVEMSYLLAGKDDVIIAFGSLSYMGRLIKIVENRLRER